MKNIDKNIILEQIDISSLIKAFEFFKNALPNISTDLERDGAIQRFEYTFELTWKTLKKVLAVKGLYINNPRDVFRDAAQTGLIEEIEPWFEFIKMRNLTVHTYNEDYALEIFQSLPKFKTETEKLISKLKNL